LRPGFTLRAELEDLRIRRIRELLAEATELQETATKLIGEITDQLQRSIFIHDDRGVPHNREPAHPDRRRKPRP
jgi:hypothetical protein